MNETLVAKLLARDYFFSEDVKIFENWVDDGGYPSIHCDVTGQITVQKNCFQSWNGNSTLIILRSLLSFHYFRI